MQLLRQAADGGLRGRRRLLPFDLAEVRPARRRRAARPCGTEKARSSLRRASRVARRYAPNVMCRTYYTVGALSKGRAWRRRTGRRSAGLPSHDGSRSLAGSVAPPSTSVLPTVPPSRPRNPPPHKAVAPATRRLPPAHCPLTPSPYHSSNTPTRGEPCPTDTPHPPSFPRRRESRVGRGPAQPITYPPPPRNPPPTWPSRQRPAKAGIQGGARPCAAHHLPPATPQPSPHMAVAPATREGGNPGWGAALRSPSPTPRHPATLPPHGRRASDPRRRESRVGRGPAQPITYPPPPRNPPPTWPSRQRPAKAGIQGGARPCAAHHLPPATPQPSPHMAVAPATRESGNPGWRQACAPPTKPSRSDPRKATPTLPGGLPPKNNQRAKPCRSYRESPPSKQSTLCVPSRFRRRKKKDRLSTEL